MTTLDRPLNDTFRQRAILFAGGLVAVYAYLSVTELSAFFQLASLVGFFLLGRYAPQMESKLWLIFSGWIIVNVVIALLSHFSLDLGFLTGTFGLYGNKNYFGVSCAFALAGALAFRFWWLLPASLIGLWLSHSRGAYLGAGVAIIIATWCYSKFGACCLTLLAFAAMVELAGGEGHDDIWARVGVWQDTINHLSFFGHGFGSFFTEYKAFPVHTNMTGIFAAHAYNDFLELVFELGIFSLGLWLVLIFALDGAPHSQVLLCATLFALSLTFFPLSVPPVGQLFLYSVGLLSQRRL